MTAPPAKLDGATVLAFSLLDGAVTPTGYTRHVIGGEPLGAVFALAIARYETDSGFYLFYCDATWQVRTDTYHESFAIAQRQAEFEFAGVTALWRNRGEEELT